jgi:hypothetical protein
MAINLSDNIQNNSNKPVDNKYGPYSSTTTALSSLVSIFRHKGLTVGIETGGVITEYWFKNGTADADLVLKQVPGITTWNSATVYKEGEIVRVLVNSRWEGFVRTSANSNTTTTSPTLDTLFVNWTPYGAYSLPLLIAKDDNTYTTTVENKNYWSELVFKFPRGIYRLADDWMEMYSSINNDNKGYDFIDEGGWYTGGWSSANSGNYVSSASWKSTDRASGVVSDISSAAISPIASSTKSEVKFSFSNDTNPNLVPNRAYNIYEVFVDKDGLFYRSGSTKTYVASKTLADKWDAKEGTITRASSKPSGTTEKPLLDKQLWLDESSEPFILKQYDLASTTWKTIGQTATGLDGKSAYEVWRDNGNPTGTVAQYLAAIKGAKGDDGGAGASSFTYIAYADSDTGTGFTTTYNASKDFIAVRTTTTAIASPVANDFTGLWKNYKGAPGLAAPVVQQTGNSSTSVMSQDGSTKAFEVKIPRSATASAPANPATGDLWLDTTLNIIKYRTATAWVNLINTDASSLASGTLPDGRLSTNVPLLASTNNFTGLVRVGGTTAMGTSGARLNVKGLDTSASSRAFRMENSDNSQSVDIFNDGTVASTKVFNAPNLQENSVNLSAKYRQLSVPIAMVDMAGGTTLTVDSIPETEKVKLRLATNWDNVTGIYIGEPLVGCFQGTFLCEPGIDTGYMYQIIVDNLPIRLIRG